MNLKDSLRLAFGTIRAHKLRSALTTLGVMIGVMTVIGMLSFIDGLNSMVANQLAALGTNTLYVQKLPWAMTRQDIDELRKRRSITIGDADAIRSNVTYAKYVAPMLSSSQKVMFRGSELTGVELVGTVPEYQLILDIKVDSGRQILDIDLNQQRMVAMIGATIANELFGDRDPLGQMLTIGNRHFSIIGVLAEKGTSFGVDQDNIIIIPITSFIHYFSGPITMQSEQSATILVQPQSPDAIDALKGQITGIMRRRRALAPNVPDDFSINTAEQLLNTYRAITSGVFTLMIGVTSLSLVVGGIGIMNIMLVSVSERIKEIGIRKALGARRSDIRSQFLIEAVTLSCTGGIVGMLLGFLVAFIASAITNFPVAVSFGAVLLGFGFSVFVGVFFGWFPSSRAAAMNPIEALRHE
ncbi:MAG: ABC transporter permease [Chitinispirillales bacterium]|jgi:putative ABC transport system permease protein|nr:ABC transporter permease [Chitinispirillales bacterium]